MPAPWDNKHLWNYPNIWANRGLEHPTQTAVHYHAGTSYDGCNVERIGWSLYIGSLLISQTISPKLTYDDNYFTNPYYWGTGFNVRWKGKHPFGQPGFCTRIPRAIRLIVDAGWYSNEIVPLKVMDLDSQSPFITPLVTTVGDYEKCIDYVNDLGDPLASLGNQYNLPAFALTVDWISNGAHDISTFIPDPTFTSQTIEYSSRGQIIGSYQDYVLNDGAPGGYNRYLYNLAPRYAYPGLDSNTGIMNWYSPFGVQTEVPISLSNIVGGEVLNIVLVSDAYGAYHGVSTSRFVNPDDAGYVDKSSVKNDAMYDADIQRIIDCYPYFEKWGLLIVQPLKNPIGFPCWSNISLSNQCRQFMFWDAQQHFQDVKTRLTGAGIPCEVIMRDIEIVTNTEGGIGENMPQFTRDPITIDEIMAKVESFWSGGGF